MSAIAIIRGGAGHAEIELGIVDANNQYYCRCTCGFVEFHVVQKLALAAGLAHSKSTSERETPS